MTYRVEVSPGERYWILDIPAIGFSTEARTTEEIDLMARDLIEEMTGETNASIDVVMNLPGGAEKYLRSKEFQAA